jgi:hypothetical protein
MDDSHSKRQKSKLYQSLKPSEIIEEMPAEVETTNRYRTQLRREYCNTVSNL